MQTTMEFARKTRQDVPGVRQATLAFRSATQSANRGTPDPVWVCDVMQAISRGQTENRFYPMPTMVDLQVAWNARQSASAFANEWHAIAEMQRIGRDAQRQLDALRSAPHAVRPANLTQTLSLPSPEVSPSVRVAKLRSEGVSLRGITQALGIPQSTVRRMLGLVR